MAEQVMERNTLEGEQNELRTSEVTVLGMFSLRERLQRKMIQKVLGFFFKTDFVRCSPVQTFDKLPQT